MVVPVLAHAQASTGTGTVQGRVTDASGAAIAGAAVEITNTSTRLSHSTQTNDVGLYVFANVQPGTYDVAVTKAGFKKATVAAQQLIVGQSLSVDATLEVGASTQTVEVKATAGAQLQTLNSTMGTSINGVLALQLPSFDRDVASLLYFQPTVAPNNNGAEGNVTANSVAGQQSDQNTFIIDGGNATSSFDGDNAYVHEGRSPIPTNVESTEEFQVNTNNQTADYANSTGGQVLVATKRGTNAFHGSVYDFLQNSALDSNSWGNNVTSTPKQKSKYNRFGLSVGGPMLPSMAGGKTYFYFNYEGLRWPRSVVRERSVPLPSLLAGIVTVRDGNGNPEQYNLKTATNCGLAGNEPCDPRGLGIAPVVSQMWSQYMPPPNDFIGGKCAGGGDKLNTCGFRGSISEPINNNYFVGRIDHDFGSKLRWLASYRTFKQVTPTNNQTDIGGLLPGDKKGVFALASHNTNFPRYFVTGLTATPTPTITNDFHFNFLRSQWQWLRNGYVPQISGIPASIEIGGESGNALIPVNIQTQSGRARLWNEHDWDYRDTLTWMKGNHLFQFGGEYTHFWWHFDRYDDVVSGLTHLVYQVTNSGFIFMPPDYQPMPCSTTVLTNCIPKNQIGSWNANYAMVLGMVSQANVVATRSGANLTLNQPLGQPIHQYILDNFKSIYFSDVFHIKPNLTLTYGLNYSYEPPPVDIHGYQSDLTDATGNPLSVETYLANRLSAAKMGQTYAPVIGFNPVANIPGHHLFRPYHGMVQPRVALAWSPNFDSGTLGTLFGHKSTVIRGGWSRLFDRSQAVDLASDAVLGDGYLQPAGCGGPNTAGACLGKGKVDPTTAFRLGIDGNTVPIPLAQTLQTPVKPGVNAPYISGLAGFEDYAWRPGLSDTFDFSIQRQLKGDMLLEIGYVGNWTKHIFNGIDLSDVPWMMKLNGQTWAQAYDNLFLAQLNGTAVAPQPFIEAGLGAANPFCAGYSSCSAAVATKLAGNIGSNDMYGTWSQLDNSWKFGPQLLSTTQCFWCYGSSPLGFANYQAMVVTFQKRTSHGLTFTSNLTYGHALGTNGLNQEYTLANVDNPWDLRSDYGPQYFDRKLVFNFLGEYDLPFGKGRRWATNNRILDRVVGGWTFAPIFTYNTGLPTGVWDGSCSSFGAGNDENCPAAVPSINTARLSNSAHNGVLGDSTTGVGIGGDPANGGFSHNLFTDPNAVFNGFHNCLVGICGRQLPGGQIRGQARWNLDFSLNKTTQITERVKVELFSEWFNALNHMQWADPGWNAINDPYDFGVLYGQYNPLQDNYTRVIQIGARVSF